MEQLKCRFEILFIETMELKKYSPLTQKHYLWHWRKFKQFKTNIHQTRISSQDIRDYLVNLNSHDCSDSFFNQAINAIRFMFKYVLNRKIKDYLVFRPKKAKTQPILLDESEITAIFSVCKNLKHLAILSILYSAGLRGSEIINLKISDIDSKCMLIWIRSAKGRKDRKTPLDKYCLDVLRKYYLQYKPIHFLFNGQGDLAQYSKRSIQLFLKELAVDAGITKRVYPHLIRHCNATHNIENGTDLIKLKEMLGHCSLKTTSGYVGISSKYISQTKTPLSFLVEKYSTKQLRLPA